MKDKFYLGAAMRGRYDHDGKIQQHIELNGTEFSNALTTVLTKDCLVVEVENWRESMNIEGEL